MAFIIAHAPRLPTVPAGISAFFSGLAQGIATYIDRHSRVAEVERLEALSDAELAKIGVRRDLIIYHVFSDRFWI
jgi:uncharacterized protein YjiS (DUF1127 family)